MSNKERRKPKAPLTFLPSSLRAPRSRYDILSLPFATRFVADATHYLLPTTCYPLPATHYLLPTTHYLLPTTRYLLHWQLALGDFAFPLIHQRPVDRAGPEVGHVSVALESLDGGFE